MTNETTFVEAGLKSEIISDLSMILGTTLRPEALDRRLGAERPTVGVRPPGGLRENRALDRIARLECRRVHTSVILAQESVRPCETYSER